MYCRLSDFDDRQIAMSPVRTRSRSRNRSKPPEPRLAQRANCLVKLSREEH